jgi:hypothetical protein
MTDAEKMVESLEKMKSTICDNVINGDNAAAKEILQDC